VAETNLDLRELRLRNEPLEVEAQFTNAELKLDTGVLHLAAPVRSTLVIRLQGDCVKVRGHLEAACSLVCSRCTRLVPLTLEKDFSVDYWPELRTKKEGEELSLTYADLDVGFYRNEQLDLGAVVSEQIVLDVPMKVVCREDCRGLCSQCGADLNEGDCGCQLTPVDPRLAALADLKKRLN